MIAIGYGRRFFSGLVLITALVVAASAPALADTKIGVLNFQSLMSDSKAAQSIQKQLEDKRKSFQDEFSKHERTLVEKEKSLVDQRAEMSAEEFAKSKQAFENEVLETRKLVQQRQRALEQAAQKSVGELRVEVTRVVADIAKQKDFDIILSRQNVVLAEEDMDITADVLTVLDKQVKTIKVVVE